MSVDKSEDDHDLLDVEVDDDSYYDEYGEHDSASDIDDEGWDDEYGYESESAPEKKKSSLGNMIIIGVAVIAGIGFMLYKFGSSPQGQQDAPKISMSSTQAPQAAAPTSSAEQANVAMPQVAMTATPDVSSAEPVSEPVAMPPMGDMAAPASDGPLIPMPEGDMAAIPQPPADMSGGEPAPTLGDTPPPLMTGADIGVAESTTPEAMPPVVGEAQPPMLQPVSDFPSADMIKKVNSASEDVAPAASAPEMTAPVDMAASASAPNSAPVSVSSLELDQAMAKIKDLQSMVEQNDESMKDYQSQIQKLEDQVSELQAQLVQAKAAKAPAPVAKEPNRVVKAVAPAAVKPAVVASAIKWTLKGAQSGRALLASGGDLRRVAVGDQVPGLGRILSIEKGQAGWVVLGTAGKVTQ